MNSEFPKIITMQRKQRKLSQKQVAADLGISQALLSHYEKGIRECGLDFVVKIADYYNVSCDYLLGRLPENKSDETLLSDNDIKTVTQTASDLLSICKDSGNEELKREMSDFLLLNIYKMFRIINEKCDNNNLFTIPTAPAENLADSVIMNICASIKLKSDSLPLSVTDQAHSSAFEQLVKSSENKITKFHSFYHST
ncbi:MAG: helix-turn-helix transcriptional regulator [Oscillospiraceae bacterium]|nr:helix-turn-helix transcriptional regulator [Oscillospiraceae bacterium]